MVDYRVLTMEQSFWQSRWDEGRIGFHLSEVNPTLMRWFSGLEDRASGNARGAPRVLVPLCGKSKDLVWLAAQGCDVVGVEFVERAALEFFEEQGVEPARSEVAGMTCYSSDSIRLIVGDFFQLSSEAVAPFDWVYDRAALVAIDPPRRSNYAAKLTQLTRPGGALLLISFEHDIGSGPPFSVPPADVEPLLHAFEPELMDDRDILANAPRFKERGATFMREQVYLGCRAE